MPDERNPDLAAAVAWWRALQPQPRHADPSRRSGDRAALARLRRCTRIEEAGAESAAVELARRLKIERGTDPRLADALLAAIVLAQVREDRPQLSLGRSVGADAGGKAVLSPMRLTRLLTAETHAERLIVFRRLVALLGGAANLRDLARLLLHWNERNRIALVFDYHNAPAPGSEPHALNTPTGDSA